MTAAPEPPQLADVVALIRRLRAAIARPDATAAAVAAVAGAEIDDAGAPLGLQVRTHLPGVEGVTVTRQWDSEVPNAATLRIAPGRTLAELVAEFGSATPLPRVPKGDRMVRLGGGEGPASVLASLDDDQVVRSIMVRREI